MSSSKVLSLNNGKKMPIIGLGTYRSDPNEVKAAVKTALKAGYRHIDCAYMYKNEKEVGQGIKEAIQEGIVKREDIFVTTKLWNTFHRPELVAKGIEESLNNLGLDYVDLYLIHWPTAQDPNGPLFDGPIEDVPIIDTWRKMEELYKAGKAKSIGVSNFNIEKLQDLLNKAEVKPVMNQVENHPYLPQHKLVKFCHDNDIQVTAYCPLGPRTNPKVLVDPIIKEVAEKNHLTPAQVVLSWNAQRNVVVIPKSVTPSRIEENFHIAELNQEDIEKINGITYRYRCVYPPRFKVLNIFNDLGDF